MYRNVIKCAFVLALFGCSATSSKLHNSKHYEGSAGFGGGLQLSSFGDGGSCIEAVVEAKTVKKPIDIIFVIDNSGSMSEEVSGVVTNIDTNFAQIMAKSGIDYRIIILSKHGGQNTDVCIEAPLSTIPIGGCGFAKYLNAGPGIIPGKFYQYSIDVESNDSPCLILQSLFGQIPDMYGLAPAGLTQWLREEATKVFIEVSDDRPCCNFDTGSGIISLDDHSAYTYDEPHSKKMASDFDSLLTSAAPKQFGTPANRNYVFYSLTGLQIKNIATNPVTLLPAFPVANPLDPFYPPDLVTNDFCPTAVNASTGYQWLSKMTGGLRSPICLVNSYATLFTAIAKGIYANSAVVCNIDIAKPKAGEEIDYATMQVYYSPGGDVTKTVELNHVNDLSSCSQNSNEYYYNDNITKLCPTTCAEINQDAAAKLEMSVGCIENTH